MKKFFLIFSLITLIFTFSIPCYANEGDISAIPDNVIEELKSKDYDFSIVWFNGQSWEAYVINDNGEFNDLVISFDLLKENNSIKSITLNSNHSVPVQYIYYYPDLNSWDWCGDLGDAPTTLEFYDVEGNPTTFSDYRIFVNNEEYFEGVEPVPPETDLSFEDNVISLLQKNNEILSHIYAAQLFAIAVVVVTGVVFLLYKFLKSFY